MSPRTFPTTFVWDHGGTDIHLFISKPNGNETLQLNKSVDGTFEVTTELGQGRYEYCFTVDGKWTHDPDLPAIKNENGHYSNMLKIVDPKINFSNKAAKLENLEKVGGISEGGIRNFVEKCYSDATINEILERENLPTLSQTLTTSNEHYSNDDSDTDEFPDLDDALEEALDFDHPKFITESPHPARKFVNIPLPSSNTNLNLSQDKINEINLNNTTNNDISKSSKTEKDKHTSDEMQEQGILTEKESKNIESEEKQKAESKSSETKQEIPPNYLNVGKKNGISPDLKPCCTETENISNVNIEITENEKTEDDNKQGIYLEKSVSSIYSSDNTGVDQDLYLNKEDKANTIDGNLTVNEGTLKAAMDAAKENNITTLPDDLIQKGIEPNTNNMETKRESKTSAEPTSALDSSNSLTKEKLNMSIEHIHDNQSINTGSYTKPDVHLEALMESDKIKETNIDADLLEHEIMLSYEDEVSNYYASQVAANTHVKKTSPNGKEVKDKTPSQEVILATQPTDQCGLSDEDSKIKMDEKITIDSKNIFDKHSEMSNCSEVAIIEGDVNGNIIDNDTHPNEYSNNIIDNPTSNRDTETLLFPEINERNLESIEMKLQIIKSNSEIKETKSDIKETKSDIKETKSDIKETKSDIKETKSDIKETKSDIKETKSDNKETISDITKTKSEVEKSKTEIIKSQSDITKSTTEVKGRRENVIQSNLEIESKSIGSKLVGKLVVKDIKSEMIENKSEIKESKSDVTEIKSEFNENTANITESKQRIAESKEEHQSIILGKAEPTNINIGEHQQTAEAILIDLKEKKHEKQEKTNMIQDKCAETKELTNEKIELAMLPDNSRSILKGETDDLKISILSDEFKNTSNGENKSILVKSKEETEIKLNGEVDEISRADVEELRSNRNISDQDCDKLESNKKVFTEIADLQNPIDTKKSMTSDAVIWTGKNELIPTILISIPLETETESNIIHEETKVDTAGTDSKEIVRDVMSDRPGITEECEKIKYENGTPSKDEKCQIMTASDEVDGGSLPKEFPNSESGDTIEVDKIDILTDCEINGDQTNLNNEEIQTEVTKDFEIESVKETIIEADSYEDKKDNKQLIESKEKYTNDGGANENVSEITNSTENKSLVTNVTNDLIDLSDHINDSVENLCKDEIDLKIDDAEDLAYGSGNESVKMLDDTSGENVYQETNKDIPTKDSETTIHSTIESNSMNETNEVDTQLIIEDLVNELVVRSDNSEILIKIEKSEEEREISNDSHVDKLPEKGPKDLFSQVNNTLVSIQKSKSNADLKLNQDIPNQDVISSDPKKDILESVKDNSSKKVEKKEMNKNLITKNVQENKQPVVETLPVQSPMEQRREAERIKMERMRMSKKLDEVFGVIQSESVDDMKTEIKVRGMGDVNLKRQVVRKTTVEHNKMDEYEQKRVARQQISMPEKPATFKKPKPKIVEKVEEPPKPIEEAPKKEEEKPKPKKKSCFVFIQKPTTPPKEATPQPKEATPSPITKQRTPDLQSKFWPTPELPTPPKPEYIEDDDDLIQLTPGKPLPLKIGINGFDRIGRLAFRAAFEAGLEVSAVNDPFIPLHYMVYSLKFDLAHNHSKSRRKEITVTESPLGELIVNGKIVTVFTELDPRKIPWDVAGVNYVIEATESLQSKVNARHHLQPDQGAAAMKDIVNREEKVISGDFLKKEQDASKESPPTQQSESKEPLKPVCNVKKVIMASNSTEFPSFGIGINDERISQSMGVIGNISAQANALILPLKIILDNFGIKFCSYTLLKAIIGPSKDIKCPNLGPATHSKAMKWDFSENLVPAPCPVLEEETLRFLPSLRGKLHGIVVYTPVPEVSMFDLTICIEKEADHIYNDICQEMRKQAEGMLKNVMKYVVKIGDETSASCIFTGCPQSVVFDERSGCQIDRSTVKIVLWFDNEYGFANRVVDLVKKAYQINIGN